MEAEIGVAVDGAGLAAREGQQVLVHDEVRVEEDRFVAGVDGGEDGEEEAAGDAGGDEDFADVATDLGGEIFAEALAQGGDALGLGVAVLAGLDSLDRGLFGGGGDVEIREADRKVARGLHPGAEGEKLWDSPGRKR